MNYQPTKQMDRVNFTLRLDRDLYNRIADDATREYRTLTAQIHLLLHKAYGIQPGFELKTGDG